MREGFQLAGSVGLLEEAGAISSAVAPLTFFMLVFMLTGIVETLVKRPVQRDVIR